MQIKLNGQDTFLNLDPTRASLWGVGALCIAQAPRLADRAFGTVPLLLGTVRSLQRPGCVVPLANRKCFNHRQQARDA